MDIAGIGGCFAFVLELRSQVVERSVLSMYLGVFRGLLFLS